MTTIGAVEAPPDWSKEDQEAFRNFGKDRLGAERAVHNLGRLSTQAYEAAGNDFPVQVTVSPPGSAGVF